MRLTTAARARLANAALILGIASLLTVLLGIAWSSTAEGEAVFLPLFVSTLATAVVSLAGVVCSIAGLVRRAWPTWKCVTGLVCSGITLLAALVYLVMFAMLVAFLQSTSYGLSG